MTTNQTIDGVPIATIAAFARVADAYSEAEDDSYEPWQDAIMHAELRLTLGQFRELRALLDAKPAEEFNPEGWAIDHSAGRPILVHNNCSVIEAEQAYGVLELIRSAAQPQVDTVPVSARWTDWSMVTLEVDGHHRTYVECEKPEQPQGVPVAWQIRTKTNREGSTWTDWRQCSEMERALHSHEAGKFNRFGVMREIRPVYAEQPAPVAEQLIERLAQRFPDLENMYTAEVFADWLRAELNPSL